MKSNVKYSFLLVLAAMIWGAAFVAQIVGMDYLKPFSFPPNFLLIFSRFRLPTHYMEHYP